MSATALLVVDMLNPYEHEDADVLARHVAQIVEPLSALIARASDADVELVYVNDNYRDFAATSEQCVLYSALDAYVRHYALRVPRDAVAHIDPDLGAAALRMMERNMRAEIVDAVDCLGARA
jgi:nicotinamidase-related amidase